jgi:isoleucyl-tRNA synthetase
VSQVTLVAGAALEVRVARASGNKCPRCWLFKPEVGAKEVCDRCAEALA